MRTLCWISNDFLKWLREHTFCYYSIDREQIKRKVQEETLNADKFKAIEQIAPDIQSALDELKIQKSLNISMIETINEYERLFQVLYIAHRANEKDITENIFKDLIQKSVIKELHQLIDE